MAVNGKHFKQFLHSQEFSIIVERIVSIYSKTLLKKIQNLEDQLRNIGNINQTLEETISKIQRDVSGVSEHNPHINNVTKNDVDIKEDNVTSDLKNSDFENSINSNIGDKQNTNTFYSDNNTFNFDNTETETVQLSEISCESSSPLLKKISSDYNRTENVLFDKDIFVKHLQLPKRDYEKCMLLGVCTRSLNSDKIVFESAKKRYWIHLENCKPRSRSEKIVKGRLEETVPGK